MKITDVIRRPLITEKTTIMREDGLTMVFEVAAGATKVEIKAVEQLLGPKVDAVRTSISHGKFKRQGRFIGQRSDWKKAYVGCRTARSCRNSSRGPESSQLPGPVPAELEYWSELQLEDDPWLFANTTRHRRGDGSRRCRPSTRSPRPSRTSR